MEIERSLILLRVSGVIFSLGIFVWAFTRYRDRIIWRRDFFLAFFLAFCGLTVSVFPDSINIVAGILAMDDKQYGRIIVLLILSNSLLWLLIFGQRARQTSMASQFDRLFRYIATETTNGAALKNKVKEVMVVIPALNEAENLKRILPLMPKKVGGKECGVLVVDDGSSDNTKEVVEQNGCLIIVSPINRGGGAALRLGYDICALGGAEVIVTMDGDGQHLPEEIERLVMPVLNDQADIVIGSRVLGEKEKDSLIRLTGIYVFSFIINVISGTRITDCSNGFRAFRMEALQKILLLQDQFHTAELIIDAARKNARIQEVPITVLKRFTGESKKGRNLGYGFNFFKTVLKTWLRK